MANGAVDIKFTTSTEDLDARLDRLMDALVEAGVPDPFIGAKLSTGEVTIAMGVDE